MTASLVVKIGGSLLLRPDLPHSLRHWLVAQGRHQQINIMVGGGAMIDSLRELDRVHQLETVAMHWRCVSALRYTMEIVSQWLPEARVIDTPPGFARHSLRRRPGWFLIAADAFYHPASGDDLPCDWTTTSDSIAALLARKLAAERLMLLKACEIAQSLDIAGAAAAGIVDPVLPRFIDDPIAMELVPLPRAVEDDSPPPRDR